MHGGATPAVRAAAERRRAEAEATALYDQVWKHDAAPVSDPVMALQRMAGQLEHAMNVLGAMVNATTVDSPASLAWARVVRESRQLLVDMGRLGIASRAVEIQQQQADLMLGWLTLAFEAGTARGVTESQRTAMVEAFLGAMRRSRVEARAELVVVRGEVE